MSRIRIFELILSLLVVALILPVALHPDLIMLLFLPPLLMSSAVFTVWRDFRAERRPIRRKRSISTCTCRAG
jgi:NhaP-type Na+/H+ or K+/H+ antiporter